MPVYRQIGERVKQLIAAGELKPGDRLPTVRDLARSLGLSPGTILRAYTELEEERITRSRRGGGTTVAATPDDPRLVALRQRHLSNIVGKSILEALSQSYSPDEIEAAFMLDLARWREERQDDLSTTSHQLRKTASRTGLTIVASDDWALSLLVSQLKKSHPQIKVELKNAGSLGGLIALQEGRADLAGIHLLDEETGEYNYPYIKHILPGRGTVIVHLAYRIQGLIFARGNPKAIQGIEDLRRPGLVFLNRQNGSGTRVLLDFELRERGIAPSEIDGYENEVDTHLAVARAIAKGDADAGMGIEAAARACGVDFLPLSRERYDLVTPIEKYQKKPLKLLLKIVGSHDFRRAVSKAGGYDTSETGTITYCQ